MTAEQLAALVGRTAAGLGFEACGVTDLSPTETGAALEEWLRRRYHGEMAYMARQADARREPQRVWPGARSAVVVLHNYHQPSGTPGPGRGRIASYAAGDDYHAVVKERLGRLGDRLVAAAGGGRWRAYVDAGPLPERELARRAGLGWIGKNTMLIHPRIGSFTFIGVLLTDIALARGAPFQADHCGTCRRCLEACPTDAFPEPRVLDATRCIAYLTIEAKTEIPETFRPAVGDHLFGCDICQEVCPWNIRFAPPTLEPRFRARAESEMPTLKEIVEMDERGFDDVFGGTALERAGRCGLARNARVVLENMAAAEGNRWPAS